jgi:hypothetical protein
MTRPEAKPSSVCPTVSTAAAPPHFGALIGDHTQTGMNITIGPGAAIGGRQPTAVRRLMWDFTVGGMSQAPDEDAVGRLTPAPSCSLESNCLLSKPVEGPWRRTGTRAPKELLHHLPAPVMRRPSVSACPA